MANRNPDSRPRPDNGPGNHKNPFMNPIGSVGESSYRDTVLPDTGTNYIVYGEGGNTRHQGNFRKDNPYFEQLMIASNNQDKDALYELAIQWEADYANLQEQREYNQGVLEEQREYDSPVNQIARARAAGINPDLDGSSGSTSSGSSAQMQIPAMADQTGQTKFSNSYDNTQLVFEGINTAANFVSSMAGGVSGIMGAVSQLMTMPSQIALNEANAGLSGAKANEINQLLDGKKKAIDLSNIGQGISNTSATLQQLAHFSKLIAPNTADMAPHLKALGVEEAQIAPYTDLIKQLHANPEMRDHFAKAELSARWSEEQNSQYTNALVAEMTELQRNIDYEQKHWTFQTTQLQGKIAKLLNTDSFAQQTASNEMTAAMLEGQALTIKGDEMKLYAKQLAYDTAAHLKAIEDRAVTLTSIDNTITALYKQPKTPERDAQINRLNAERVGLRTMLSNEFYKIKDTYLVTSQQIYQNQTILDADNQILPEAQRSGANFFSDVTFNDLIHHTRTPDEIANQWVRTAVDAAGVAVDAAGVARGFHFNKTYKEAHDGMQFQKGYKAGREGAFSF